MILEISSREEFYLIAWRICRNVSGPKIVSYYRGIIELQLVQLSSKAYSSIFTLQGAFHIR